MNNFKKGDVLSGDKVLFEEAFHPVIFIDGSEDAPFAVVLTHSNNFSCNTRLLNSYDDKTSYFVAHLIEKMSEWGPYRKVGELEAEDMQLIEGCISGKTPITWAQYEAYTRNGCPEHG